MEDWSLWQPMANIQQRMYVDNLILDHTGFTVKCSDDNNQHNTVIYFPFGIHIYRYLNDSFCFYRPVAIKTTYSDDVYKYRFFRSTNSQYLKKIASQSNIADNFIHFCIIGGDEMVDIIARDEPIIQIGNSL